MGTLAHALRDPIQGKLPQVKVPAPSPASLDASIRAAAFGYVAWVAVALVRLVAAGRCPTV